MAGCNFAPAPAEIAPVTRLPDAFAESTGTSRQDATAWWTSFGDPVLNRIVDTAIAANLDIREAVARVEEVRAQYRISNASIFPTVQASGDFSRSDVPANAGQFGAILGGGDDEAGPDAPTPPDRFSFETFGASLGFAYELDVWGRLRAGRSASIADLLATGWDLRAVEIGVVAETIAGYFEILELGRRSDILREQLDLLEERLALTADRYDRGVVTSLELYQIQQDVNATRAQLPLLEAQLTDARGRLGILLGRFPAEMDALLEADALPSVSTDPLPSGLPSTLLNARPDVVAASARLEAARLRVGERRAARFPVLSLTGSAGTQSSELADLVRTGQWFTNFVGSITAPLFNGGRLAADEAAARARYEQEATRFARTVLTSFKEVEASLAAFNAQRARHAILADQAAAARSSAENQLRRLELGIGDYVAYLDALRQSLNVENTRVTAERDLAVARLNVHRALGGSWIELEEGS
jgi:NodT family efflux transporter outer membrane factor (OMF) lipoprotein